MRSNSDGGYAARLVRRGAGRGMHGMRTTAIAEPRLFSCDRGVRVRSPRVPCGDDGTCAEGICNENSGTCVQIVDEMVYVPEGPFWMGCREGQDTDEITGPCPVEELPYRQVTLDAYWIDQYEVSKGAYRTCMDAGVCTQPSEWDLEDYDGPLWEGMWVPGPDTFPAASVSWSDASAYCTWVGKRLPTEAEWEKAARGTDGRTYPWGNDMPTCDRANYATDVGVCSESEEYPLLSPAGFFPAGVSVYGALDMAGNVKEWTNDGMQDDVGYEGLPAENPTGVEAENLRVFRGGGYQSASLAAGGYVLRASRRGRGQISWTDLTLDYGIRCAKDAE
jgi:formylglycine-generating enzyme required for sulfatase activity